MIFISVTEQLLTKYLEVIELVFSSPVTEREDIKYFWVEIIIHSVLWICKKHNMDQTL